MAPSRPTTSAQSSNVAVAVRVRPLSAVEKMRGDANVVSCDHTYINVCSGSDEPKCFVFDRVYDEDSAQGDVYAQSVQHLVEGTLAGLNSTVLAYGQTGSGKTHTMGTGMESTVGSLSSQGVLPRAVYQLFDLITETICAASMEEVDFSVQVQFIEIYKEKIIDLFVANKKSTSSRLRICHNAEGVTVVGASTIQVKSAADVLDALKRGTFYRTTGTTNMNAASSRSHAIFTIFVTKRVKTSSGDEGTTFTAKLNFVDLAGSERMGKTGATGLRAKEGISINRELLSLGKVITALASKDSRFVNYRESQLTRLLQDSLGGNSRTLLFACVSPSSFNLSETVSTLRYAAQAKLIENKICANRSINSNVITTLKARIAELEAELDAFRSGNVVVDKDSVVVSDKYEEIKRLQEDNEKLRTNIKALEGVISRLQCERIDKENMRVDASYDDDSRSHIKKLMRENEDFNLKLAKQQLYVTQLEKKLHNYKEKLMSGHSGMTPEAISEFITASDKSHHNNPHRASPTLATVQEDDDDDTGCSDSSGDNETLDIEMRLAEMEHQILEFEKTKQLMMEERMEHQQELHQLQKRIAETEIEKATYLADLKNKGKSSAKDVTRVKETYEQKINALKQKCSQLEIALQEKAKSERLAMKQARAIETMKTQLLKLEDQKRALSSQLKDITKKSKEAEKQQKSTIRGLENDLRKKRLELIKQSQQQQQRTRPKLRPRRSMIQRATHEVEINLAKISRRAHIESMHKRTLAALSAAAHEVETRLNKMEKEREQYETDQLFNDNFNQLVASRQLYGNRIDHTQKKLQDVSLSGPDGEPDISQVLKCLDTVADADSYKTLFEKVIRFGIKHYVEAKQNQSECELLKNQLKATREQECTYNMIRSSMTESREAREPMASLASSYNRHNSSGSSSPKSKKVRTDLSTATDLLHLP